MVQLVRVGVFAPAAILTAAAALILRKARPDRARYWERSVFLTTSFLLGLVGTTIFSEWADTFILTWPASLYLSFRMILALSVLGEKQPRTRRTRLVSGASLVVFLGICFGYYKLCAMIGYVLGWCFLMGFLPAAPAAAFAARQRRWWVRWILEAVGFSVYFWFSGMLPDWKQRGGD